MSSEGDSGGQVSTTSVSTIAVQAGQSRIIVALLKCGMLVELQLAEAAPNLLEIGSSQDESQQLLAEHELLMKKLKANEDGVWSLLSEADRVAEENADQELVYDAMARTLSEGWVALVGLLEKRRGLLLLASEFFDRALEFAIKIDEAEELQRELKGGPDPGHLEDFLHKHNGIKKVLLEKSMALLNKSQELLSFIKDFQQVEAFTNVDAARHARASCLQVDSLMEVLQDRRRQVERQLKQQLRDLEGRVGASQWAQEEQEVTSWFKENMKAHLEKEQLGASLSENENLLQESKELEKKAREWSLRADRLVATAKELLAAETCGEQERLAVRSKELVALQGEFWHLLLERMTRLQEANLFFSSANKAFDILGTIEGHLKALGTRALALPALAKKHEELLKSVKDTAADALQKGQAFLKRPQSTSSSGIEKMVGYIQARVDHLSSQCYGHRDLSTAWQKLISGIEDHADKVSSWIHMCSAVLAGTLDPGSSLSESEDVLNKHLEMTSQSKDMEAELVAMGDLIAELLTLECPEVAESSNKACLLSDQLKTLSRNISARAEHIKTYVTFLKSAEEIDEQMDTLEEFYRSKPLEDDKDEDKGALEQADSRWHSLLEMFLTVQDQGHSFINSSKMVSASLNVNVEKGVTVVENMMASLAKKKAALADLWTTWQLHANQMKSVKKQWKKFKEQLKKTLQDLKVVEDGLMPTTKVDLGSDLGAVTRLKEHFEHIKPQFQQINAEVEYLVKISELLALKGIPNKEKNEKVDELLHVHKQVKEKIKEYEGVLNMALRFHQLGAELESLLGSQSVPAIPNMSQAKIQLSQHQEKQVHIRSVYQLAVTLGTDISRAVQQSKALRFSTEQLKQKVDSLKSESVSWTTEANKCEESLLSNVNYCAVKEETTELRESFKDLKKKFNNLKFNYMKKNDKARNMKAVKYQLQQVEMYAEKIQVLQKKLGSFTAKVSAAAERQALGENPGEVEEVLGELQKQVADFDKTVVEYKQHLDMSVRLQQAMEEYQFWCEEASATVVRVGRYSSECQTKEAVGILYKQFEKFVWPTVPQQEERINQITELAVRLHGAEEGKKFVEKTVSKHTEILESIKELCNGLRDLEEKLQAEADKETDKKMEENNSRRQDTKMESGSRVDLKSEPDAKRGLRAKNHSQSEERELKSPPQEERDGSSEQTKCFLSTARPLQLSASPLVPKRKLTVLPQAGQRAPDTLPTAHEVPAGFSESPVVDVDGGGLSQRKQEEPQHSEDLDFSEGCMPAEVDLHNEFFMEETMSNDEYDCASPDDISLPPLSETPESNILHSETDLDEGAQSPHGNQFSQQGASHFANRMTGSFDVLTPGAAAEVTSRRREWTLSAPEGCPSPGGSQYPKFRSESSSFVRSPLTVPAPTIISSTLSSILKSKASGSTQSSGTLRQRQETHYAIHESFSEMQEKVVDSQNLHPSVILGAPSTQASLSGESELDICKPTTIREEIRLSPGSRGSTSVTGQGPGFSKLLANASVKEGSPVTLEVEVTGYPEPALTWYRNGQKVSGDERVTLSRKEGKHSIFIAKAIDKDAGLYVARAKNSSGTLSSSAILQVQAESQPPHFIASLEDQALLLGEDLFLECRVSGKPPPRVLWLKDQTVVAVGEARVPNPNSTHVLLKRHVLVADSGRYVCIARNEAGEACSSAIVFVQGSQGAEAYPGSLGHKTRTNSGQDASRSQGTPMHIPNQG
ncbi:coiled-coil domain-containing protein 141 isoform X1 [Polypterus senegalus]|uniref:coiled-coil domain-containing protein 141 isoform X1 n=1 Tax=Polypterus senegalus TaxID=55291 RepID=UPI0019665931|nr:coiled-coil domain-containing protein 141 isoform X1 [Polypterus senegalus]